MLGGMSSQRNNELYLFNTNNDSWKLLKTSGNIPEARCYHSSFIDQDLLFIYGGKGDSNRTLAEVSMIDLNSLIWKTFYIL